MSNDQIFEIMSRDETMSYLAENTQQIDLISTKRTSFNDTLSVTVHNYNTNTYTDFTSMKNVGFKYVRDDLQWNMIETSLGIYDFSPFDININNMISQGITPIMILGYANSLYTDDQMSNAFVNFVDVATKRYAGKGIVWEIWNEPNYNLQFYASYTREQIANVYSTMMINAVKKIRVNDSNSIIIAAGLAFNNDYYTEKRYNFKALEFLDSMGINGAFEYIDGVSIHPYSINQPPENELHQKIAYAKKAVEKYTKKNIPIYITEIGWTTADRSSETIVNGYPVTMTEQNQADYLCRALLLADMYGVPLTNIYQWSNSTKTYSTQAQTNVEQNWGLVYSDWLTNPSHVKIIYNQLTTLTTSLNGFTFAERVRTNNNDYVLKYIDSDFNVKYVYWTKDTNRSVIVDGQTFNLTSTPVVTPVQSDKYTPSIRNGIDTNEILNTLNIFGTGKIARYLNGADANNYTENGIVTIENGDGKCSNVPSGLVRGKLVNIGTSYDVPGEYMQLAFDIDNDKAYFRKKRDSDVSWGAWKLWSNINDTGWIALTPISPFTSSNGFYYRIKGNEVMFKGSISNSTWTLNTWVAFANLPTNTTAPDGLLRDYPASSNGTGTAAIRYNPSNNQLSIYVTSTAVYNVGLNHIRYTLD